MASVAPTQTRSDTGYVDPHKGVFGGVLSATQDASADGTRFADRSDLRLTIWYFTGVDDGDTWDSSSTINPPKQIVSLAWQPDDVDDDWVSPHLTTQGGPGNTSGVVTFQTDNASSANDGWLWVLSRG